MEIEKEVECSCPKCGVQFSQKVFVEIETSDLAQDTYGD